MLPLFRENSKSLLECTLKGIEVLGMQKKNILRGGAFRNKSPVPKEDEDQPCLEACWM